MSHSDPQPRQLWPRVLLFGGDGGNRNLGDQAMLLATVRRLRQHFPTCTITVLAANPDQLPDLGGVRRVHWPDAFSKNLANCRLRIPGLWRFWRLPTLVRGWQFIRAARTLSQTRRMPQRLSHASKELLLLIAESDLVVNYGSGGLNDIWAKGCVYPWAFCYLAAHALGKKILVTGQGIGPLTHPLDRRLLCAALNRVNAITVRDCANSAAILRCGGVNMARLHITADDAFSFPSAPREVVQKALLKEGIPQGRPLVALSFRTTAFDRSIGKRESALMADVADRLVVKTGANIFFISTCYDQKHGVDDRIAASEVLNFMRHTKRATVLKEVYDAAMVKGFVAESDLVIGTTYHPLVFALSSGTPAIGLYKGPYYTGKVRGLFGHYDMNAATFDFETCTADEIIGQALSALRERQSIRESISATTRRLNEELNEVWVEVEHWFDSSARPF